MSTRKPYLDQVCVILKGGMRLWVESDRWKAAMPQITDGNGRIRDDVMVVLGDAGAFKSGEITSVMSPAMIDEEARRRLGDRQCPLTGEWHGRDEECSCMDRVICPALGMTEEYDGVKVTREEKARLARDPDFMSEILKSRMADDPAERWRRMMRENRSLGKLGKG